MTRQIPEENKKEAEAYCAELKSGGGKAEPEKADWQHKLDALYKSKGDCAKAIKVGKMTRQIPEENLKEAEAYCAKLAGGGGHDATAKAEPKPDWQHKVD